jgi:hypothetical protein
LVGAPRSRTSSAPGPWWAPGGTSHQVGWWSGEARGPRGGATGGAALTTAPGRAAGAVFVQGVCDFCEKWHRSNGPLLPVLGPQKIRKPPPCVWRYKHPISAYLKRRGSFTTSCDVKLPAGLVRPGMIQRGEGSAGDCVRSALPRSEERRGKIDGRMRIENVREERRPRPAESWQGKTVGE